MYNHACICVCVCVRVSVLRSICENVEPKILFFLSFFVVNQVKGRRTLWSWIRGTMKES